MSLHKEHEEYGEMKLARKLKQKAREILNNLDREASSTRALVAGDIQITLEHIDSLRELHKTIEEDLLRSECYIDTELMQGHEVSERVKLQAQLLRVEAERRKLVMNEHEQLRKLNDSLASLLNKHTLLTLEDDN